MKHKICLITGNEKKLKEFQQIVGDDFEMENQNVDLPELQGDPLEVAKEKSLTAFKQLGRACLTEDTSLCFNAYKGLPGPYIKWFFKSVNVEGLAKMVEPFDDKTGYAMCIIGYMAPDLVEPVLFVGKTEGEIVAPRGSRDFGWDPVFQPTGYTETYAELSSDVKNKISHRFRAIDEMKSYFKDKPVLTEPKASPKKSPKKTPARAVSKSPSKSPPKDTKKSANKASAKKQTKSDKKNKKLQAKTSSAKGK